MALDPQKLEAFIGRFAGDLAATLHASTVVIGDKLGLYRALAEGGPQTADELADRTGYRPQLVREWLNAQAASEYCEYDPAAERYSLSEEQAAALADESSPAFVAGGMLVAGSTHKDEERVRAAFTGTADLPWSEHAHDLFHGTDRFFRPGYVANLVTNWIPALEGVEDRLREGVRVADVGCGLGSSTILMAEAYPASRFWGFDYHRESIEAARKAAAAAGVADRVTFEVAGASDFPGSGYDLITVFDALHDMGDPVGAARHIREALTPDGTWLLVEPQAQDRVEDNLNLFGRIFYSASTSICVPNALSQGADDPLGAQAGEARLREVATQAGFSRFRRATETPFNQVLEARP
jgi:2-polyprenyl-3-methyl-5-hydroxy-6-metoxy-1,4-benzoquinol methylase